MFSRKLHHSCVHCHKSSHTKLLPRYLNKQRKYLGVFFQILCYQTEIKVDSTGSVFDRPGHFSFNVNTLFRMSLLFSSYLGYNLPLSFAGQFRLLLCYHHYGLELSVNHPVPVPCFFPMSVDSSSWVPRTPQFICPPPLYGLGTDN